MGNEADFRALIRKTIWNTGLKYWPMVFNDTSICPHCKKALHPIPNRPDIILSHAGIECKTSKDRFDFDSISEGQRNWANSRTEEGYEYYLALQIYSDEEKKAWLVDWNYWISVEVILKGTANQNSIPLRARRGMNKVVQEHSLDAVTLLRDYELKWNKGWTIPDNHPVFHRSVSR